MRVELKRREEGNRDCLSSMRVELKRREQGLFIINESRTKEKGTGIVYFKVLVVIMSTITIFIRINKQLETGIVFSQVSIFENIRTPIYTTLHKSYP